jgi:O-acetyl-ADP-ribose deacetylase (regulator of RNase III)
MLSVIEKDITTVEGEAIIMHGVNCQNQMGSGVAKALYEKWAKVKEKYHEVSPTSKWLGGTVVLDVAPHLYVANCFTQDNYGYDGEKYASVPAIMKCLVHVADIAESLGLEEIYAPKIGCGLGGLDWETEVKPCFDLVANDYTHLDFIICELPEKE